MNKASKFVLIVLLMILSVSVYAGCTIKMHSLTDARLLMDAEVYSYTGLEIKPSVVVTHNNSILKINQDYRVAYFNNIEVGQGMVVVTGIGKFDSAIAKTFRIQRPNVLGITVEDVQTVYDGTPKSIVVQGTQSGDLVTYSLQQYGEFLPFMPSLINAGTYDVFYKIERGMFSPFLGRAKVVIAKAEQTNISATAIETQYDGSQKSIQILGAEQGSTIQYKTNAQAEYTNLNPTFLFGSHTVMFCVTHPNYSDFFGQATVNITEATIKNISAQNIETVFDGSIKSLIISNLQPNDIVRYRLGESGEFSLEVPNIKDVGDYTVFFQVERAYHSFFEGDATIKIAKATQNVVVHSVQTIYDGSPKTFEISNLASGSQMKYKTSESEEYTLAKPEFVFGTHEIDYWITHPNFLDVRGKATIEIAKATFSSVKVESKTITFDGNTKFIDLQNLPENSTVYYKLSVNDFYTTTKPTIVDVGTYTIYYLITKDYYHDLELMATLVVELKENQSLVAKDTFVAYDGNPHTISFAGLPTNATVLYASEENGVYSAQVPYFINVSTNLVFFKVVINQIVILQDVAKVIILKADPIIEGQVVGSEIVYEMPLFDSQISGATANVEGSFMWLDPFMIPTVNQAKNAPFQALFVPSDLINYNIITVPVTVSVLKKDPLVNFYISESNVYQQNERPYIYLNHDSTPGVIEWEDKELQLGQNFFDLIFIPNDADNFNIQIFSTHIFYEEITFTSIFLEQQYRYEYFSGQKFDKNDVRIRGEFIDVNDQLDSRIISSFDVIYPDANRDYLILSDTYVTLVYQDFTITVSFNVVKEIPSVYIYYVGPTNFREPFPLTADHFMYHSNVPGSIVVPNQNAQDGWNGLNIVFEPEDTENYQSVSRWVQFNLEKELEITSLAINDVSYETRYNNHNRVKIESNTIKVYIEFLSDYVVQLYTNGKTYTLVSGEEKEIVLMQDGYIEIRAILNGIQTKNIVFDFYIAPYIDYIMFEYDNGNGHAQAWENTSGMEVISYGMQLSLPFESVHVQLSSESYRYEWVPIQVASQTNPLITNINIYEVRVYEGETLLQSVEVIVYINYDFIYSTYFYLENAPEQGHYGLQVFYGNEFYLMTQVNLEQQSLQFASYDSNVNITILDSNLNPISSFTLQQGYNEGYLLFQYGAVQIIVKVLINNASYNIFEYIQTIRVRVQMNNQINNIFFEYLGKYVSQGELPITFNMEDILNNLRVVLTPYARDNNVTYQTEISGREILMHLYQNEEWFGTEHLSFRWYGTLDDNIQFDIKYTNENNEIQFLEIGQLQEFTMQYGEELQFILSNPVASMTITSLPDNNIHYSLYFRFYGFGEYQYAILIQSSDQTKSETYFIKILVEHPPVVMTMELMDQSQISATYVARSMQINVMTNGYISQPNLQITDYVYYMSAEALAVNTQNNQLYLKLNNALSQFYFYYNGTVIENNAEVWLDWIEKENYYLAQIDYMSINGDQTEIHRISFVSSKIATSITIGKVQGDMVTESRNILLVHGFTLGQEMSTGGYVMQPYILSWSGSLEIVETEEGRFAKLSLEIAENYTAINIFNMQPFEDGIQLVPISGSNHGEAAVIVLAEISEEEYLQKLEQEEDFDFIYRFIYILL